MPTKDTYHKDGWNLTHKRELVKMYRLHAIQTGLHTPIAGPV